MGSLQGECPSKPRTRTPHRIGAPRVARTQAPELFAYPPVISAAADVYAFAVLAWVVVTREQPYRNLQSAETAMAAMLGQVHPISPYSYPYH